MKVKEARRLRLLELERIEGALKAIAHRINPGSKYLDRYLSQIKTGVREMGDALAEKIEKAYKKPKGWMDHVGTSSIEASELLHVWSQFSTDEQERIVKELKFRLKALKDEEAIRELSQTSPGRSSKQRPSS